MRLAVIGGRLQGIEACYLAQQAGWEVLLIDKEDHVPASGLCDRFIKLDVTQEENLGDLFKNVDLVLPALENQKALNSLSRACETVRVPLIFDSEAYTISSSKLKSNQLFSELQLPKPKPWPDCNYPLILKPSGASGSEGVARVCSEQERLLLIEHGGAGVEWVIEEFIEGPSYSLEVVGFQGIYRVLQITELEMDDVYDCKRVLAPVDISDDLRVQFEKTALVLATALNLNGIMDVEVILHEGLLKILEIDARLPSQTPITVYHSTGLNMLEILARAWCQGECWGELAAVENPQGVIYEQIAASGSELNVCGEHVMAKAGPLQHLSDFFGADCALTNYQPGKTEWVATLIISAQSRQEAWDKRCRVIEAIKAILELPGDDEWESA